MLSALGCMNNADFEKNDNIVLIMGGSKQQWLIRHKIVAMI